VDFLFKPIEPHILRSKVDVFFQLYRQKQQLAQSLKERTETLRVNEMFTAVLGHDLRGPLSAMMMAAEILSRRDDPAVHEVGARLLRSGRWMGRMIEDMLDLARTRVGSGMPVKRTRCDLGALADRVVQERHCTAPERALEVKRLGDLVGEWDEDRMTQVVSNLIGNALRHGDAQQPVDIELDGLAADEVVMTVGNGGVIAPDVMPHIFDLFTQADRSLDRAAGGLGIGLSLAQRLVALHGGSIEAHSPPDGQSRGSEFVVRLPLLPTPPERPTPRAPVAEQHEPARVRVLVIDDSHDLVLMLGRTLRHLGYSVQNAYTGPDGLAAAVQWRPDIVLMDIGLPGLDGYEVARRLRSDPTLGRGGEQMKLIALTGYGQLTDITLAREAGFDAHLTKPYEIDELEELLRLPRA